MTMSYNLVNARGGNSLLVTDVSGNLLQTISLNNGAGSHQMSFDVSNLPAGIYFVTLMSGKEKSVQMLVITK